MIVTPIKTHKITKAESDITKILEQYLPKLEENSVVAITSKIVALCERNVVEKNSIEKDELVKKEADYYISRDKSKYNILLTVKDSMLLPSAGIDESNANGDYVLLPKDSQASANQIREYLAKKFNLKNVGVVITDSKTTPLRWGVTGWAVSHSGFKALNDLIGTPDIFGRAMESTKVNVMDGLAASAVLAMGESNNQTPIAILTDLPFVEFQEDNPTQEELDLLHIELEDDVYYPILKNAGWEKKDND